MERRRYKKSFHVLVHSPNACISRSKANSKTGIRSFLLVSHSFPHRIPKLRKHPLMLSQAISRELNRSGAVSYESVAI